MPRSLPNCYQRKIIFKEKEGEKKTRTVIGTTKENHQSISMTFET
jgi:hypothetical protein